MGLILILSEEVRSNSWVKRTCLSDSNGWLIPTEILVIQLAKPYLCHLLDSLDFYLLLGPRQLMKDNLYGLNRIYGSHLSLSWCEDA